MRAIVLEGSEEEVLGALDALGTTTEQQPKVKAAKQPKPKPVQREPLLPAEVFEASPVRKKGMHRKYKPWTKKEDDLVRAYYGDNKGRKKKGVIKLAKVLGRTYYSVRTRAKNLGIAKQKVVKVVEPKFPKLTEPKTPVEITASVFKSFVTRRGRTMEYSKDGYFFGIDDMQQWNRFAAEVMLNARAICGFFEAEGDIVLVGSGPVKVIEYR